MSGDDDTPIDIEGGGDDVAPVEGGGDEAAEDELAAAHRTFTLRRDLNVRIDRYLHGRLKGISRNKVQKLIDLGGVTVNGKRPKASTIVRQGDVIDIILPPPAIKTIVPEPIPLDILYEDENVIVINKQAGLIVHPARSHTSGTLVNGLAYHFKQQIEQRGGEWQTWRTRGFRKADQVEGQGPTPGRAKGQAEVGSLKSEVRSPNQIRNPISDIRNQAVPGLSTVGATDLRPGIIHRLDKYTTGVIVVAKSDEAHWQIARQFEERTTLKAYLAVVHGNFTEAGGVINEPIGKHPTMREAFAIRRDSYGKQSITLFRVREQYEGYCLVELELKTGRTHQIRVHLSYLGHPIAGDIVYGGEPIGQRELDEPPVPAGGRKFLTFAREREEGVRIEELALRRSDLIIARPALHAAFLRFMHPMRGQAMTFTAPLHSPMSELVRELRKRPSKRDDTPVAKSGTWVDLAALAP
ncbi:MAG: RluA family pseudouridine synthase [Phycisphaeraceae bacterium]